MVIPAAALHGEVIRINDRLVAAYNKIALETAIREHGTISAELRTGASALRDAFQRHEALSADRALGLDEVEGELGRAAIAAQTGNNMETWAALMRTHGRINGAIADFLTKQA